MAKFAMHLVDLEEGIVHGSNDVEAIQAFTDGEPERFLIIHSTYGQYQQIDGQEEEIAVLPDIRDEPEDDDEDEEE